MHLRQLTTCLLAIIAALSVSASRAQPPAALDIPTGSYQNDPAHTSLTWRIGHMGLSDFTARVRDVSITLELNAQDLSRSQVKATIDPASVDTGYPFSDKSFDDEVGKDPRFLNAPKFPEITFVSNKITLEEDGQALIRGKLTLLGVTRSVTLNGVLNGAIKEHPFAKVPAVGFTATTTIDRTDFGLDYLSGPILDDEVDITIQAEFTKQ